MSRQDGETMGYPSDVNDEQWVVIEPIVTYKTEDDLYNGGRPRTVDLRRIVNALFYMDRTGGIRSGGSLPTYTGSLRSGRGWASTLKAKASGL